MQQEEDSKAVVADTGERSMQFSLSKMHIHTREIERRAMRQVKAAMARTSIRAMPVVDPAPAVKVDLHGVMAGVDFRESTRVTRPTPRCPL